MNFYFKKSKKDIIMAQEDVEDFEENNTCRTYEKEITSDYFRDLGHLTRKYRGSAHNTCSINVTQKHINFIPFEFHNFKKK